MPRKKPLLHPTRKTIARMRERLKHLDGKGVIDRAERRKYVVQKEIEYWEGREKEWVESTKEKGGSPLFMLQLDRTNNKIDKLLERLDKAKTSERKREIMERLGEIPHIYPPAIYKLEAIAQNTRFNEEERVAAVRALSNMAGSRAPEFLYAIVERNPKNDAARTEIVRILSKTISGRTLELTSRALKSRDIELRVFGLDVLAGMPSELAITTLAGSIRRVRLKMPERPIKITDKMRDNLQRVVLDKALLRESRADAKKLMARLSAESRKSKSRFFSLGQSILLVGFTANAINKWLIRFGEKGMLSKEFCEGLILRLESNREQLSKLGRETAGFAIRKIDDAIKTLDSLK